MVGDLLTYLARYAGWKFPFMTYAPMKNRNWLWNASVYVGLGLVTVAAYSTIGSHQFITLDDPYYVYENENVTGGLRWENICWAFTTGEQANWHPMTWLSHMLDCQLFGVTRPGCHHFISLMLHVVNTLLMFYVFQRMTGAFWRPVFVATIFSLHPLHVESVAWISERKDVLSTSFWLLSVVCYIHYVTHLQYRWYLLVIVCLAAGLMSKSMLVTAPFVFLLLDYWPLYRLRPRGVWNGHSERSRYPPCSLRWLIVEKLPMLLLTTIAAGITYLVHSHAHAIGSSVDLDRPGTAIVTYVRYLEKSIWPVNLAVLYPELRQSWPVVVVLSAAALLGGITSVIWAFPDKRYFLVGWLWFLGTLVPVIGFVQIGKHSMADRYMYVPLTGLLIILAWGLPDILERWKFGRGITVVVAFLPIVACFCWTVAQVERWQDSFSLFGHALEVTEDNYVLHNNLGVALEDENREVEALEQYQRAVLIQPAYFLANKNLGRVLVKHRRREEAIVYLRRALQAEPDDMELLNSLANSLAAQGDLEEAIEHYRHIVEIHQEAPEAQYNLGLMMHRRGQMKEAIDYYRQALSINPDLPAAHNNLGMALQTEGNVHEAIRHFQKALQLDPNHEIARRNLTQARAKQRRAEP